jgi:hypothetical protein
MKRKAKISLIKKSSKPDYYQETVVEPAKKLLKALIETEAKESAPRIRKTAISR